MDVLKSVILATYVAQIIQVCFFAVPSAGSTLEMLFKVKKDPAAAAYHPAAAAVQSRPKMAMLIVATGAVSITSLMPLAAVIYPPVVNHLIPFTAVPSALMNTMCVLLLIAGNVLTYVAVAALRAHVSFHAFGEATRLYTAGIYGWLRNPITSGLALIYAGFFLALPSVAMLLCFIFFIINSAYRIRMEEKYLQHAFGDEYTSYKRQVGKYFPRLWKSD